MRTSNDVRVSVADMFLIRLMLIGVMLLFIRVLTYASVIDGSVVDRPVVLSSSLLTGEDPPAEPEDLLYITITDPEFPTEPYGYDGGLDTILVSSNVSWEARFVNEIASIVYENHLDTVIISIPPNTTQTSLYDTLIVYDAVNDIGDTLLITLSPLPHLSISLPDKNLEYGSSGEKDTIIIESDVLWQYKYEGELAEVTYSAGIGTEEDTLFISVGATTSLVPLYDTLVIYVGDASLISDTIYLTQSPFVPSLSILDKPSSPYAASGETNTFVVSSNVAWVSSKVLESEWLTLGRDESDTTLLIVTLSENAGVAERTDTVIVSNTLYAISDTLIITQSGLEPSYSLSIKELTLGSESGSVDTIYLTSNALWEAIKSAEWLSVSPVSGSGAIDTLIVSALSKNELSEPRADTIYISGLGGYADTILVTQRVVEPASVEITIPEITTLLVDSALTLTATVYPADAIDQSVTWESLDESIATIEVEESSAKVTGVSIGDVSIVVTTVVGGYTDTLLLTITSSPTGLLAAPAGDITVTLSGSVLTVTSPSSESLTIYTPGGSLLYTLTKPVGIASWNVSLPSGVLIIKGSSGWSRKVIRATVE